MARSARMIWRLGRRALDALASRRGQMLPWAPVCLGLGIGLYFALRTEPGQGGLIALCLGLGSLTLLARRGPDRLVLPAMGLALVTLGFLTAAARSHLVAAPVLTFRYYGPVEGRVVDIDRSFSDQIRVTLDRVSLADTVPGRTPAQVRIALHGDAATWHPEPGQQVRIIANVAPPDGPVAPGGFDFQRLAWFSRLGGVGYSRKPVEILGQGSGWTLWAFRARMDLSQAMQAGMHGQAGAFAAALMTGDRSGVTAATNDMLRASNLSHMISISGLHMGLLTGFVFALCRYGLALVPPLALRANSKKLAAWVALAAATFYMLLAGPDVATRRSYVMAAVMLVAVLCDRRAISLRTVAIAALICLMAEPESLVEPGFQMSFGATLALIVGFEHWRRVEALLPGPMKPVAMAVLSSLIAGTATAPIAAAHFNRIAEYGLLANLLAVPVMGIAVMPAGVIAALLAPLGLAAPALWVMEKGCAVILYIAGWVAGLGGAVIPVPAPPDIVLPLLGLAGSVLLIARLWPLRLAAAAVLALAFALWGNAHRPDLLIGGEGTLAGLMTPEGRALSKAKGAGFVAQNWLEDDGDAADQETAALRAGFSAQGKDRTAMLGGAKVLIFTGKGARQRAEGTCAPATVVVLSEDWGSRPPDGPCLILDLYRLRRSGTVALSAVADGLPAMQSARDWAGSRPWNTRPPRPKAEALALGDAPAQ